MNYKNVKIDKTAKIAKQSVIIGDVTIGRDSCVLYYSVIRGDDAPIAIGEETNIQENCTIHVSRDLPVHIGNNVTIGHNAVIHSCTIGDRTLIGMGAIILDGAKIGSRFRGAWLPGGLPRLRGLLVCCQYVRYFRGKSAGTALYLP